MSLMLGLLILLGLIGLSYWILRKRQAESNRDLSIQVQQTLESVRLSEEKIVQTDTKLAEQLLEVVMQLKQPQQNVAIGQQQSKPDHSLPLKLADEIHRMRKRLAALPDDTKGLKPLSKSLERLEDELQEQGYEIIDYIGMKYTENMSVKARFIPSDDLDEGQSMISKVVTPQVNFNGILIRMADVEVSVG
jgi:flagellar biogenesis protein FliO